MDISMSKGVLSEETLQFANGIENVTMNNIFFGCGHNNSFHNSNGEGIPGLIGLTTKPESLVSQLHYKKFAYCLGDFDDIDARGYAAFGDAAQITGGTTPLADSDLPYYFLNLEAISVENTILPIPKGTFTKTKDISSGFVIDSGSTYPIIRRSAFNILQDNLRQRHLYQNTVADPNDSFDLCFKSDVYDLKSAPVITLHFTGLSLQLPFQNTWEKVNENIYCLSMLPSDGVSLLGNFQQQNYNVGHDLENRLVSFVLMYCSDWLLFLYSAFSVQEI
ncbi:hypothetical protein IFM89_008609 [Coptis chinensis]|uniref:Peptidase A1 domain-containing protein n=1 Tax=Coptis chinensis TaxID=261450 RepID=A0A835HJ20_9MAGN|nr:hypothetical protein IFM89_008609 [Coptis chinensis]